MPTNIKKSKRRRYIRHAVELEALLVTGPSLQARCTILDFCAGGLFLGFDPKTTNVPLNQAVKIYFSIDPALSRERFEIEARAVHVTGNGAGVAVDNMPQAAFNALSKVANAGTKPAFIDRRNSTPDKASQENFKNAFKQLLIEQLGSYIDQFFASIGSALEIANDRHGFYANPSAIDDLVTTLKLNREAFASEFCSAVIFQLNYIAETTPKKQELEDVSSLSLVEKDDFEDWLNMSAIGRKLNNRFEEKLNQLTRELGRVFGLNRATVFNPINPTILCDSFRDIILQFELSNDIKQAIYHCFGTILDNGLAALYDLTSALLSQQPSAQTPPVYSAYKPNRAALPNDWPPLAETVAEEKFEPKPLVHVETAVNDALHPEPRHIQPITEIAGKLLQILSEAGSLAPGKAYHSGDHAPGDGKQAYFSADEVAAALTKLQRNVSRDSSLHADPTALSSRLQEALKSTGQESKSLSDNDIHQLEVYGKFFETLFNEFLLSSDIRQYLESIHLPLLSLPLQGNDFLDAEQHPVRNIINQLAILEPAVKRNKVVKNTHIRQTLETLINRIVEEAETNNAIFTEVEHELEALSKQVTKSADIAIRRIVEIHEGQQRLVVAQRAIQQEIDQRIAGKLVPSIIPTLLDAGWQQLLVIAELNKEKHPDRKQTYLDILDDIHFWLYEQESILRIQSGTIQKTLEFIEKNLRSVCPDTAHRHAVIDELTALLLGSGTPKVRKKIETVKMAAVSSEQPSTEAIDEAWIQQVEQLHTGEWLTISYHHQGYEPMKLVWIGETPPAYIFVNRDGLNKLNLGKIELAELLRSGEAYRMENLDTPLMDRATNAMLQKMHEKLVYNATHDPITNLFTRDEFVRHLKIEMSKLDDAQHVLCHIDVLDFRVITNICGLGGGEQLLKKLAQLMTDRLRNYDLSARLGDKSFAILFKHCSPEEGHEKAKKLLKLIGESHFQWQEKSFAIGVSMGLVPFDASCFDVHQLLQQADAASISAERLSQNRILMFSSENENLQRLNKLYEWTGHIDSVFSQNRLFVRCQRIAPIEPGNNEHQHYEILLGVRDDAGNIIPPDHFIPAVERCKRMSEIDQWIITNVFDWIENHKNEFNTMDGFSINLSGQSINSEEFLEFLKSAIESGQLPTEKLTFEITETIAAENIAFTKKFIQTIKSLGCKFSLDDFGSGYSSYSYLKNLNADFLKIDGAFVKDIVNNKADVAIVKSMNEIAHSLGLKTIAEYVENDEIRSILIEIGVDYGQGYGIQKPIPLTELVIQSPSTSNEVYFFEDNSFWEL